MHSFETKISPWLVRFSKTLTNTHDILLFEVVNYYQFVEGGPEPPELLIGESLL